jgi:protein O-GlcNAc transferase
MPDVADRIHFMPRLDREQFLQLLSCATVMLDPVHFGGGNTTYEALALGVPIVTWPSPYMRGRVTAACYQRMGLPELIAHNAEEYIALAVHLGSDPAARAQAHEQILSKNTVLYEDAQVIEELEAFFLDALAHHQGDLTHG